MLRLRLGCWIQWDFEGSFCPASRSEAQQISRSNPAFAKSSDVDRGWLWELSHSPVNQGGYLVDPASSHMLVSKIKPCMSKYKLLYTVKLRMAH